VENATDGINCILKSFNWNEGDVVLIPNTAYACVRNTVVSLKDRYKITVLTVTYP
jgi:selenocysteine lyase/cysteine desulfurase